MLHFYFIFCQPYIYKTIQVNKFWKFNVNYTIKIKWQINHNNKIFIKAKTYCM